jgi:DNA-directed RNA polymerase specialized sigma24 family protein
MGRVTVMSFLSMTDPNSYCGRICGAVIYAFVRRQLQRYHLNGIYSENDIIHEMYIRWVKALSCGTEIRNLQPWIRGCCLNIVRELSRKHRQTYNLEDCELIPDIQPSALDIAELKEEISLLQAQFQNLKAIDQIILDLKIVKGYSWEKVRNILEKQGHGSFEVVSLRKRKERAMKTLRLSLTGEA